MEGGREGVGRRKRRKGKVELEASHLQPWRQSSPGRGEGERGRGRKTSSQCRTGRPFFPCVSRAVCKMCGVRVGTGWEREVERWEELLIM